jgi:regulator of replication initiation timing
MQINLDQNPSLKDALFARLKAELAETMLANFALDMIGGSLTQEKAALEARVAELVEANTRLHHEHAQMRAELERVTRPERVAVDPTALDRRTPLKKTA